MTTRIEGVLEVDEERKVVYFHSSEEGKPYTVLRICQLPPFPPDWKQIDVTNKWGASIT